jgi:hypothetical protein
MKEKIFDRVPIVTQRIRGFLFFRMCLINEKTLEWVDIVVTIL